MFRSIIVTVMFLSALQAQAAQSVQLKVKHQEMRLYETVTKTVTANVFDIKAPKETMEQFASAGLMLPLEVNQSQTMQKTLKTGRLAKDGRLPFSGSLENSAMVTSSRGTQDSHKHFEMTGTVAGAVLSIDTVKGEGITPELEERVKQALANAMASPAFPEKPLNVGENFAQEMPVTIPVQGSAPIQIVLTTSYTLKKLDGPKAYFDIAQRYAFAPGSNQETMTLSGKGSGKMTYDRNLFQVTAMKTDAMMELSVKNDGKETIIKTKSGSDITTTVTPVK